MNYNSKITQVIGFFLFCYLFEQDKYFINFVCICLFFTNNYIVINKFKKLMTISYFTLKTLKKKSIYLQIK